MDLPPAAVLAAVEAAVEVAVLLEEPPQDVFLMHTVILKIHLFIVQISLYNVL